MDGTWDGKRRTGVSGSGGGEGNRRFRNKKTKTDKSRNVEKKAKRGLSAETLGGNGMGDNKDTRR